MERPEELQKIEVKLQLSQGGGVGEVAVGRGRINEGITSIDIMYICKNTNVSLNNTLYGEGWGSGEGARGKPTKGYVHVCHYDYELHYDVRL